MCKEGDKKEEKMSCIKKKKMEKDMPPRKEIVEKKKKRCSACTQCLDFDPSCKCEDCERSRGRRRRLMKETPKRKMRAYTWCEIRRHRTVGSAWLVKGRYVYDVTDMIPVHPGGEYSILRHSGGQKLDCTEDFNFHSAKGQKIWNRYKIGMVVSCPSDGTRPYCEPDSCSIM
jgi:cytochrome b involved in lipid metabolism